MWRAGRCSGVHVASSCSARGGWPHMGIRPSWMDAASDTGCHKARESASSFSVPCCTILCYTSVSMRTLHSFVCCIRVRSSIQPRPVDGTFLSVCIRPPFQCVSRNTLFISSPVCVVSKTLTSALPLCYPMFYYIAPLVPRPCFRWAECDVNNRVSCRGRDGTRLCTSHSAYRSSLLLPV